MPPATESQPSAPLSAWSPPLVECYETRPEVTAYAGDGGPWNAR
jgi:hypothetical protein